MNIVEYNKNNQTSLQKIIMNELKELIKKTTQILLTKTKYLVANNKKKVIALVVLIIAGYIIKKKMTMAHFLAIIDAVTKVIQLLPLPDSPKLRQLSKYQHPNSSPLKSIFEGVEQVKNKFSKKEATWQNLKQSLITGTIVTISLYNINSFYFLVQNKYLEDFKELEASSHFDQAMYRLRKKFSQEIPLIFNNYKELLVLQMNKLQLQTEYSLNDFDQIFEQMIHRIFSQTFNAEKQFKKSIIKKVSDKQANYFTSPYEHIPQKKSIILSVSSGILNILGGCIKVLNWFPEPKQQITSHRFSVINRSYILSVDKAELQRIQWPNKESKNLFDLIVQEIHYSFLSLNFSVLMIQYAKYHKKILMNRIKLWLQMNQINEVKLLKFLPALYKILKQQFFRNEIKQHRQNYHEKQLKKNIRQITLLENKQEQESDERVEPISLQQRILEQIQQKKCYQYLEKQFQLKYFNERSGYVHKIRKNDEGKDPKQIQKLLSMISGNQVLNQNQ